MRVVQLPHLGTVAAWRDEARMLALDGIPPEAVLWRVGADAGDLFGSAGAPAAVGPSVTLKLARDAVAGLETALCHSDPERFARAYDVVLRLARRDLRWGDRSDPAMCRLLLQEKAVRRDIHKMHAFVRFREVGLPTAPRRAFAAWFEPEHLIVEAAAPFFARRFGDMDWVIATPTVTARFEDGALSFDLSRSTARPPEDATEALWRTYFANIFNPARLMVSAMTSEMPRKYWKNLPEAALIPDMIRTAPARARAMQEAMPTFAPAYTDRLRPVRPTPITGPAVTLATMKPALDACRRCGLGVCASQAVAGEGLAQAALMIVGEQPGDAEDLSGRPFVGPAGQVFDRCATRVGLRRQDCYVTNAVKHFKFSARGKVRLHQRPDAAEIEACKWWLNLELREVAPRLVLAMGATAALSLTGNGADISGRRGSIETLPDGTRVLITLHPSHILRLTDPASKTNAEALLTQDLNQARQLAGLRSNTP
ncbi:MAG: UdgX family uracil-DNA binding protein [Gemmobacter sp.]|nr:UdgX family uracil-DNA binding protein [Gemmobacter sp.]